MKAMRTFILDISQTSIYKKCFYLFYQEGQDHFHGNEKSLEDQKLMKASHNKLKDEDHSKINQGTC